MKKAFLSFLLIIAIAITGCSAEPSDDANAKFVKGEDGDWIFNFTAEEFIDEWVNNPIFEGMDFKVDSDETKTWMVDKDNIHIILFEDSKRSKVSCFSIATEYDINVLQVFNISAYSMLIFKHLGEESLWNTVSKQIQEALSTVSSHDKEEVKLLIGDYVYRIYTEDKKAIVVLMFPNPNLKQQ